MYTSQKQFVLKEDSWEQLYLKQYLFFVVAQPDQVSYREIGTSWKLCFHLPAHLP